MKRLSRKAEVRALAALAVALILSNGANAAVPAEVTAMFGDILIDVATIFGLAVGAWATMSGLYTIFRVGNKMKSKAGLG